MNLVIDASVAIKWFVAEVGYEAATRLRPLHNDFHAPDLLIVEVTNAAWKKVMRREIDPPHAEQIAQNLPHYIHTLHEATTLSIRALEIAISLQHPVYDCLYLACAEMVDGAMITADKRLLEAVKTTAFAARVHHLAALPGELLPV
jgi:predicted nucleic acid-binding protein